VSELPENLRPFEGLFRPESYAASQVTEPGTTLQLEQVLPPESWVGRARRLGQEALVRTLHSRRTRSYGLGLVLGSTAIATGIAVALFTPHNNTATDQRPPETPLKLIAPDVSGRPNVRKTTPGKMVPVAKPSDIPAPLWPVTPSWESTPTAQPTASIKPSSSPSILKSAQPSKPAPTWTTILPTVSQSPTSPEATDTPPTDGPTLSPEATDTASTEAWPETPPTALSPSPDG